MRVGKAMILLAAVIGLGCFPALSTAKMGQVNTKSKDLEVNFFGSLKTYPVFLSSVDFNDNPTAQNWILEESGPISDSAIRNEFRMGWEGKAENFDFMIILESEFNLDKRNTDRGADPSAPADSGMTGEDFGVEKLELGYNFSPAFRIQTGWRTKWIDIETGGLLYGDDHPYLGLQGKIGENIAWEAMYMSIFDNIENLDHGKAIGPLDGTSQDWRVISAKLSYDFGGFKVAPFYAFSDNNRDQTANAQVHYFGAQAFGKIGMVTPRFEAIYATGDTDRWAKTGKEYDIGAWAAYGSLDFNVMEGFIPYIGAKYMTGDDNPYDDNIDAWNSITDIARYTPTFGMEDAFVYKLVPTLGSHLYSGNFNWLPKLFGAPTPGYGGISNSSSGDAPGMWMFGAGAKGRFGKFSYKVQGMYFRFAEEEGLEKILHHSVDDEVGYEIDLLLNYRFGKHFSIGNCFSLFDPGDAMQDIWDPVRGSANDSTALMNTIELKWVW